VVLKHPLSVFSAAIKSFSIDKTLQKKISLPIKVKTRRIPDAYILEKIAMQHFQKELLLSFQTNLFC